MPDAPGGVGCEDCTMADEIAPAREAATTVVVRPGRDGGDIEVLALRRSGGSSFAPGFVVFPGGAIDPGDGGLALQWFGDADEQARACAVRELAEEAGLLITGEGVVEIPTGAPQAIQPGALTRESLPEIGRWIAPDFLSARFDARFFATPASRGITPRPGEREADAVWWATPSDLLAQHRDGTTTLAWPTFKTLEALATCSTVQDVLALRIEQVPPPIASHIAPRPGAESP
jgi:8-oxo-dGTP pyrophosphatase MutT (NUDIX family)